MWYFSSETNFACCAASVLTGSLHVLLVTNHCLTFVDSNPLMIRLQNPALEESPSLAFIDNDRLLSALRKAVLTKDPRYCEVNILWGEKVHGVARLGSLK